MSERERTEAGQFAETASLSDVVDVFDEIRGPAITSTDVADHLDCSAETARRKLKQLYEDGEVDKRKVGRTTIYWYTGGEPITADERL